MHALQSQKKLLNDVASLSFCEPLHIDHFLKKVPTCHILHDDVVVKVVLQQFEYACDVGVFGCLEHFEHFESVFVEILKSLVCKGFFLDNFDCTRNTRLPVLAEFDRSKSASTDFSC